MPYGPGGSLETEARLWVRPGMGCIFRNWRPGRAVAREWDLVCQGAHDDGGRDSGVNNVVTMLVQHHPHATYLTQSVRRAT